MAPKKQPKRETAGKRNSAKKGLADRHSAFVREYLVDFNGTHAAIRAGYSPRTAGSQAHDLLKKPEIRSAIDAERQKLAEKLEITQTEILSRLWQTATGDVNDLAQVRQGQDIYASVVALKELLQNGILIETSADNRGRHTVEYFHKIAGSVTIDGRDVRLIATVRQLPDKTFHYDISRDAGAGRSGTESGLRYLEDTGSALEGTRADINMDPASVIFNREDLRRDITARVNTELERVGIGHKVRARIVPVLMATDAGRFMTVSGSYKTGEIKITPNSAESVMDVLHHEIIHALRDSTLWHRDYGLFEQSEWRALARAARAHPGIMEDIATRYADLSTAAQTEEAVAELYRLWRRGAAVFDMPNSGRVAPILQRVSAFFEALGNALRGLGFVTHGAIFERIAKGEIGAPDSDVQGFRAKSRGIPYTPEAAQRVVDDLRAELDRFGLSRGVRLHISKKGFNHQGLTLDGYFTGNTIGVSMGAEVGPMRP